VIVIPAVDIQEGLCVRGTRDALGREAVYASDPVAVARRWAAQGARWLHVIDLEGIAAGHPVQLDLVRAIAAVGVPVQVGGGFRTLEEVAQGLACGAARVLLDATALEVAAAAVRAFDDRVAALLVAGGGRADGDRRAEASLALARALAARQVRRIVYSDLARDGTLAGPDLPALAALMREVTVPVIVAGGIASRDDLVALARLGAEGAVVGRALYEGRLRFRPTVIPPGR
jgi:phosphoribosylformimino-5-aminoimidazole carboxamide ribotide isomerase